MEDCEKGKPYEVQAILKDDPVFSGSVYREYRIKKIVVGKEKNMGIRVLQRAELEEHFRLFC
jgi:hypothetical protein